MSNETLEDAVAKTAAEAAGWHTKIAKIEAQIAAENHAITIAKQHREQHALAATLGESNAIAAIKQARSGQHEAEQRVADLSIALPEAQLRLAAAERAATAARRDLAMLRAESKKRDRVAAGLRLDIALAACAEAFQDYQRLGVELQNFPDLDLTQGGGMSRWEDAAGLKRLAAALPAFFKALPSWTLTHPAKFVPLAVSETQFWSLPPEQPEKAKAA